MTLKRFGKQLVGANVEYTVLKDMDIAKYSARLRMHIREKRVFIVEEMGWTEWYLTEWFAGHFKELGFEEILEERSKPYMKLKKVMQFYGYPDFLGKKSGKWLKVELECFSSLFKYMHAPNYADVVLCYEIDEQIPNMEMFELKRIVGAENIINRLEVFDYLYLVEDEFREENQKLCMQQLAEKMGVK